MVRTGITLRLELTLPLPLPAPLAFLVVGSPAIPIFNRNSYRNAMEMKHTEAPIRHAV